MATSMRRWISFLGLGCILTAIWLLSPSQDRLSDRGRRDGLTPEWREARRIRLEALRVNEIIARSLVGDSLISLVRAEGGGTEPFVVTLPDAASPEMTERLHAAVQREVQLIETPDPHALVGVALVHEKAGGHPSLRRAWSAFGSEYFAGVVDGREICVVVRGFADVAGQGLSRVVGDWTPEAAPYPTGVLRVCGFYLAYGAPGAEIDRWLREEGAYSLTENRWLGDRLPTETSEHRAMWGLWRQTYPGSSVIAGEGCLAGRIMACRNLVHGQTNTRREAFVQTPLWIHEDGGRGRFGDAESWWMGDLKEEFGVERLRRFWTSEQDPDQAFLAVFGEPMSEWTMRWAQAQQGPQRAGPSTDRLSVLLTMLTVLATGGAAVVVGSRKRV